MSLYVNGKEEVAFERVSEAKILADLRAAARSLGEPLAVGRYRKHAPGRGWVADFTAASRFGSWAAACRAAGVRANPARGRKQTSRFGADECLRALGSCAQELGRTPTHLAYDAWVARHPSHPKAATIRYHFGRWNAALAAAGLTPNRNWSRR